MRSLSANHALKFFSIAQSPLFRWPIVGRFQFCVWFGKLAASVGGLDGNEKVPWPKWADMSASGKFVVLVFWFMVIQFGLTRAFEYADTVKVYGRTDSVLSFLRGMHDAFGGLGALGTLKGVAVAIEGRWLVFRTTKSNP